MPEPDYTFPTYLLPKQNDPTNWIMSAMQMGAQQAQQKRQMALQLDKFHLEQQEANVNMATQTLRNQTTLDEMGDSLKLSHAMKEWGSGNFDFMPEDLKTIKAMTSAEKLKSQMQIQTAEGQARSALDSSYVDVISEEPLAAADLSRTKRYSADWADRLSSWKDIVTGKRSERKQQEFEQKQSVLQAGREQIADLRLQGTIEAARIRAATSVDNAQKWMDHAKWTSYKSRMDAILKDQDMADAKEKHAAMDTIDQKYGVSPGVANPAAPIVPKTSTAPDKASAKIEASALLKQHPDKAQAIRARYKELFGEDL